MYPGLVFVVPIAPGISGQYSVNRVWNALNCNWDRVRDQGPIFSAELPLNQRWSRWSTIMGTEAFRRPAFVVEYPSVYAHNYLNGVLVDIQREEAGVLYAAFKARVWLETSMPDDSFQVQGKAILDMHGNGMEPTDQVSGQEEGIVSLPSQNMFQVTAMDQRWCIG